MLYAAFRDLNQGSNFQFSSSIYKNSGMRRDSDLEISYRFLFDCVDSKDFYNNDFLCKNR